MLPPSVLDPRKHCSCSHRMTDLASDFRRALDQNPHFQHNSNVVLSIGVDSKAISETVIIPTELLPLDHIADSTSLDRSSATRPNGTARR